MSDGKVLSCEGNDPVRVLKERDNICRSDNNPISVGRLPLSSFESTSTVETIEKGYTELVHDGARFRKYQVEESGNLPK